MISMKKIKPAKRAYSSNNNGDIVNNFGTGIKNPVGTIRAVMGVKNNTPKRLGKPPKSLG